MKRSRSTPTLPKKSLAGQLSELGLSLAPPCTTHTLNEAVDLIRRIHIGLESAEDFRLRLKWCIGLVIASTDRSYGTSLVELLSQRLWSDFKIRAGKSSLYECEKLFEIFQGDHSAYERWIEEAKIQLHRPIYWSDVQRNCLGGHSNPDVIGREAADQRDFLEAEKGVEALEKIMIRVNEGDEEAKGVLKGIRQNLLGLLLLPMANRPLREMRSTSPSSEPTPASSAACRRRRIMHLLEVEVD